MSKVYRSREGTVTALNTRTQLSTLGSETAPGPLLVPQGVTKVVGIIVACMENMAAATSYSAFIRLEGPGLKNGPEAFCAGAGGASVATGGNAATPATYIPFEADVIPAQEILVFGEMAGTDVGQLDMACTLVFGS